MGWEDEEWLGKGIEQDQQNVSEPKMGGGVGPYFDVQPCLSGERR